MKKVLLTTTALVMTAGVAAADVTFSGTAQVALTDDNGKNAAARAGYQVTTGIDFNVGISAATDNGITMSTSFDTGFGQVVDYNDDDKIEDQSALAAADGAKLTLGMNGYTIAVKRDGVDNLYDDSQSEDFSVAGSMGGVSFALTGDMEDSASSYKVGYSAGDLSITLTGTNDDDAAGVGGSASKIALSYAMGDMTLSASSNDEHDGQEQTVGVSYAMDGISVSYTMINPEGSGSFGDEWDGKIGYSAGALSASFATDEASATTMIAEYDLGGATLFAASHDKAGETNDMTTIGINFAF